MGGRMMCSIKYEKPNLSPLEAALQLIESLGKTELVVLPRTPSMELLQAMQHAGNIDEFTAREIYAALISAVG
jgi:hypothetical protein